MKKDITSEELYEAMVANDEIYFSVESIVVGIESLIEGLKNGTKPRTLNYYTCNLKKDTEVLPLPPENRQYSRTINLYESKEEMDRVEALDAFEEFDLFKHYKLMSGLPIQ